MAELIWTEKATKSIEDIADFILQDSFFYAKKTVKDIYSLSESLKIFPNMGRKVPEYDDESIKEIFYKTYRIIYKIEIDKILILSVISGFMDLTNKKL